MDEKPIVKPDVAKKVSAADLERDRREAGGSAEDEIKHEAAERAGDAARSGLDIPSRRNE